MNKSIFIFIGGSLFGVFATYTVIKTSTNSEQVTQIPKIEQSSPKTVIAKPVMKIQTVEMQTAQMPTESVSDMGVRITQEQNANEMQATADKTDTQAKNITTTNIRASNFNSQALSSKPIPLAAFVIPPTNEQVKQYDNYEQIIDSAANNPDIKLDHLLKKADTLTIEQRNVLTQKAVDMLKSGELSIEQFASN